MMHHQLSKDIVHHVNWGAESDSRLFERVFPLPLVYAKNPKELVIKLLPDFYYSENDVLLEPFIPANFFQGLSGATIYRVKVKLNEYFLKIFTTSEELVRDLRATKIFDELFKEKSYQFKFPFYIGVGLLNSDQPALLMEKVKGVGLDQILNQTGLGDEQVRNYFLSQLDQSLQHLRSLHLKKINLSRLVSNSFISFYSEDFFHEKWDKINRETSFATIGKALNIFPDLIKSSLTKLANNLKEDFLNYPIPVATYMHGDFLPANILIEEEMGLSRSVHTLIDNHFASRSIDDEFNPEGRFEVDFAKLFEKLVISGAEFNLASDDIELYLSLVKKHFADNIPEYQDYFLMLFVFDDFDYAIRSLQQNKDDTKESQKQSKKIRDLWEKIIIPLLNAL